MKRFFAVLAVLFLTACLPVEDFGTYRDKITFDRSILGDWQNVPDSSVNDGYAEIHRVAEKGGAIYDKCLNCKKIRRQEEMSKTLRVGKYSFFAIFDKKRTGGFLIRYKIENDEWTSYSLNSDAAWNFIEEKYPNQQNIVMEDFSPRNLLAKGLSDTEQHRLQVKLFDDEVYGVLSNIPDNETYWHIDGQSIKLSGPYKAQGMEKNK